MLENMVNRLRGIRENNVRKPIRQLAPSVRNERPVSAPRYRTMPTPPSGMMYAGGSPGFNESTGQYDFAKRTPQPMMGKGNVNLTNVLKRMIGTMGGRGL